MTNGRLHVGLVVPTLGERPAYLAEALDSIASQESVDVSIVVIAPASAHQTIRPMLTSSAVLIEDSGSGLAAAINSGWQVMSPDVCYWAWLGDDDRLPPDSIATSVSVMNAHPDVAFVYGACHYIDTDGNRSVLARPGRLAPAFLRFGKNLILQPGSLYRRTIVERIGLLDQDLSLAFDVDLHLRLIDAGPARYVNSVLGEFRVHAASLTQSQRARSRAEADFVTRRRFGTVQRETEVLWRWPVHQAFRAVARYGNRSIVTVNE